MAASAPSFQSSARSRRATLRFSSIYAPLTGIPLILNPKYRFDDAVSSLDFVTDIDVNFTFDFEKERAIVAAANARREQQTRALQQQQQRYKSGQTILTPEPSSSSSSDQANINSNSTNTNRNSNPQKFDLTEFENGIPPPDPWDVSRPVTEELSEVLNPNPIVSNSNSNSNPNSNSNINSSFHSNSNSPRHSPSPSFSSGTPKNHPVGGVPVMFFPNQDQSQPINQPQSQGIPIFQQLVTSGLSEEGVSRGLSIYPEGEERDTQVKRFATQFDNLVQCGFDPHIVAIASSNFPNDNSEAVDFINNFTKLRDFGFTDEMIEKALIQSNNKFEEAMNLILST